MKKFGWESRLCCAAAVLVMVSVAAAQNDIEDPNSFPDAWYRIALDNEGNYLRGDGHGYAGGTWYYYPQSGLWRQWFYNDPYDPNRQGRLNYQVYIQAVDPNKLTYAEVYFNWATPAWSALGQKRPPLPSDALTAELESQYTQSALLKLVDNWMIGTVEPIASYTVADYNPEWVSIDIRARNALIYRGVFRSCVPEDPAMGACYDSVTGDCYTCYRTQCREPWIWLGAGSSCSTFLEPEVFPSPVYRFWSPVHRVHFFTASEREKDELIRLYEGVWQPEGIAWYAFLDRGDPNCAPVHRFWSSRLGVHFYTIREAEKDKLLMYHADTWTYEGLGFYAYPAGQQPAGALPVYRFWSGRLGYHFYTIKETERDKLIDKYPEVWAYEGIAWYAFAP